MKKLIFSIILMLVLFSVYVEAQTTASYFTRSTKGRVFEFNQNGYEYGETTVIAPGSATDYILSRNIGEISSTSGARNAFMGRKVLLGINITVAFSVVASTLVLQISLDGTNYYDLATLDADVTPAVTGVQIYLADFTNTYAPYARLKFNANGLNIGTTGRVKFLYAIPL